MANFHDKLVLSKYMLSLLNINSIDNICDHEALRDIKLSSNEGLTTEGKTYYLGMLKEHLRNSDKITADMLEEYDANIVRFTKEISAKRGEMIKWKYFQYLTLLVTEIYLHKYFENKLALLAELNAYVNVFNQMQREANPGMRRNLIFQAETYRDVDLNKIAFWNATGSGKTLLMHIHIKQFRYYAEKYGQSTHKKVILITPNAGLSKQHLEEFELSGIDANIFSKKSGEIFSSKEVEVLEISKLAEENGDKTVAVESFEGNNLVLIDEGHAGMSGEKWKPYRDQLSSEGFAFEYSATLGQAINAGNQTNQKMLTQEYAKSILFDYSYKYFYLDGYGKDYRILNLSEQNADNYRKPYLTANLLSFFQQLLVYKDKGKELKDFLLHKPLWVFVGAKVNAISEKNSVKVSDVLTAVIFLRDFLRNSEESIRIISSVLDGTAGLNDSNRRSIFANSFTYLNELNLEAESIFKQINELVFNNTVIGAELYLDNLKGSEGELGIRVGNSEYFGVINVGDADKFYNLAIENGISGTRRDFSDSLFRSINSDTSSINLLIGSKKFTEGWSSWRVSSMGLLNMGQNEGSQIIQLFGRGVRLKGYNFSLKRSNALDEIQKPEKLPAIKQYLRLLETLQVFGIRANYMTKFREYLEQDGIPVNESDWTTVKVKTNPKDVDISKLRLIKVKDIENFRKNKIITLKYEENIFAGRLVDLDLYPRVEVLEIGNNAGANNRERRTLNEHHLACINWNKVYLAILNFKAEKGYHNLAIDISELQNIIRVSDWYNLYIPGNKLMFNQFSNVIIWQEIVITLLKKHIEQFYLFYKNQHSLNNIEVFNLAYDDINLIKEYDFRFNTATEFVEYNNRIEELKSMNENRVVEIGDDAVVFNNLFHLYNPLVCVGNSYGTNIQVSPVPLNESEKKFLDDLFKYRNNNKEALEGKEIHILRNQSRKGIGFFTAGYNFYPDFIIWIVVKDKQYIRFIDPKGIRNLRGINDPKIQFHSVLRNSVQSKLNDSSIVLDSFIISNTRFLDIHWIGDLSKEVFNNNNVYFQDDDDYIEKILSLKVPKTKRKKGKR